MLYAVQTKLIMSHPHTRAHTHTHTHTHSGVDVERVLKYFNIESSGTKKGASTFALAYVFHKFLLPLRATITVVSVPVIVRHLRARGWMKGMTKATKK